MSKNLLASDMSNGKGNLRMAVVRQTASKSDALFLL
jgi:hypothetical protein